MVDVSWLFAGEGAVRLRRAKTISEFCAALTSAKRAGLEKIVRWVRALVGAQDKPAKDCPTHAPERPLAVTPVQPTFWPLRTVGTDVIFSCLRCGAQVCERDLKAHERTVNHRAAASSIPRIQLRNVQVRTATNARSSRIMRLCSTFTGTSVCSAVSPRPPELPELPESASSDRCKQR